MPEIGRTPGTVGAVTATATPPQTHPRTRLAFRVVAFAEALSWAGLLIGMFFKWVLETTEVGVKIFGPIHGGIFVAYLVMCLVAWRTFGWSFKVTIAALASAVPPFFTVLFEVWADRRGLLGTAARR
ncbi:DUF3817 domain-containing protein [Mumia zhuanghuii]|uniref:DUF3817 domain-containing protein n=1 Tax=Mumia zhuanghuii TaxID=2585211 RepID=A0A5C4MQZ4_9ACTN|nr:DUF3817 domain-containing protein [Mumia zhuanghuii]